MTRPRGRAALTAAALAAALSLPTLLSVPDAAASPDPRQVTTADFPAKVVAASRDLPVVVEFYADWCGYCRKLRPVLEALADAYAARLHFVRIDVEAEPELAARLKVSGVPVIYVFEDGLPLARVEGAPSRSDLTEFVDAFAASP